MHSLILKGPGDTCPDIAAPTALQVEGGKDSIQQDASSLANSGRGGARLTLVVVKAGLEPATHGL